MSGPHETHADLAGLTACIAESVECLLRVEEAMRCAEKLDRKARVRLGRWRTFLQETAASSPSLSPADAFTMAAALRHPHRGPRHPRHAVMGLTPVLIIDDDEAMRAVLRLALEEEGYLVWEAPDGLSGLEQLRMSEQPLVVLLDWWMPGLDGVQVLQALHADADSLPTRHAFLFMTAAPTNRHHHTPFPGFPSDMDVGVLAKPFVLERLLSLIAQKTARIALPAHELALASDWTVDGGP